MPSGPAGGGRRRTAGRTGVLVGLTALLAGALVGVVVGLASGRGAVGGLVLLLPVLALVAVWAGILTWRHLREPPFPPRR